MARRVRGVAVAHQLAARRLGGAAPTPATATLTAAGRRTRRGRQLHSTGRGQFLLPWQRPPQQLGAYEAITAPGTVTRQREVPAHIAQPDYASDKARMREVSVIDSPEARHRMRRACALARDVLHFAGSLVAPGVSTDEIDRRVHEKIVAAGAYPSPLGYQGFPKSLCTSVNNVVCHGIPDMRELVDGDIVNLDVTVFLHGFHGDTSRTFACGRVDDTGQRLLGHARECLEAGIGACAPWAPLSSIGNAIEARASALGVSVCGDFIGHGIGRCFHQQPDVLHFANYGRGVMEPGMCFTVEPCINQGSPRIRTMADGWTVVTRDRARSAQFEHTILITEQSVEILTGPDADPSEA